MEEPVSTLEHLDTETIETIRTVLARRAAELLHVLETTETPSMAVREQVEDVLADELSREITAPDWRPTPHGARVDDAIGRFLIVYPITDPTKGTAGWPPSPDLRGPERAGRP
jgi:hypothetical protein